MTPRDANGIEIGTGARVRLTGTVESVSDDGLSVRVKPDRAPDGYELIHRISPRVLEVIDEGKHG